MAIFRRTQTAQSSPGSPAYDATIHPAVADAEAFSNGRLQERRDVHLFGDKSAAALSYSHFQSGIPNATAVALMGLAAQRDLIQLATDRTHEAPFPGAYLGPVPGFNRSPEPFIAGAMAHVKTHHAHKVESRRATRARFGR